MIRTFVAVELPGPVVQALAGLAAGWADAWPADAVRWTPPGNMHLTLRFLGDTDPDKVPRIEEGLDQVAGAATGFPVRLDQAGGFPNLRRPRVLWVGLQDQGGELAGLKKAVDRMLRPLGWDRDEQRFSPHLTLGRVRAPERAPSGGQPPTVPDLGFDVAELALVESRLRPAGAEYTILHRSPLGRAEQPREET